MAEAQNLKTHRKFVPWYHFFTLLVLLANVIWHLVDAVKGFSVRSGFDVLVAMAILMAAFYARVFPSGAQDRIIRNEERERLHALLPADRHGDIMKFSGGQLIGMRFASDAEIPELSAKVLAEGLGQEALKKHIKDWKADNDRI